MRPFLSLLLVTLLGLSSALSQDNVTVALEGYIVTLEEAADGTVTEMFEPAETANPGDLVEYRLELVNVSNETLDGELFATGPVPANTFYLEGTALEGADYRLQFSADGGETFEEAPLTEQITNEQGETEEVIIDPTDYNAVRWILLTPLAAEESRTLVYRVEVR